MMVARRLLRVPPEPLGAAVTMAPRHHEEEAEEAEEEAEETEEAFRGPRLTTGTANFTSRHRRRGGP